MSAMLEDNAGLKKDSRTLQVQLNEGRRKEHSLSCWTDSFTDCLVSSSTEHFCPCNENGNGAFVVIDKVMESNSSSVTTDDDSRCNKNIHKGDKSHSFCTNLIHELDDVFLDKLKPARTQGDHRVDEILGILQAMGTKLPTSQHQSQLQTQQLGSVDSGRGVRGDNSIFISREYRQQTSFPTKHPHLHNLISTISKTFERAFNVNNETGAKDTLQLDFSMTSVQLALYPGDSKSGYRRHCDRHQSCLDEGVETGINVAKKSTVNTKSTKPERLLTCIYYLTDDDWHASLDGGALRLFPPGYNENDHTDSLSTAERNQRPLPYIDVTPFRDRMVIFRSDRVQHQVMPSHRRHRLAITMWFYGIISNSNTMSDSRILRTTPSLKSVDAARSGTITADDTNRPLPLSTSLIPHPLTAASGDIDDLSPTIFVSIASFRDSETRPTIDALYSTAMKPQRIFTGIVLQLVQGENEDENIWTSISGTNESRSASKPWSPGLHQLRVMRLHARDATGPCYARGLCQSLFRGEDYVLQIDSHMRFRKNWDEYLIQTIKGLQDRRRQTSVGDEIDHCDKIMLTAYPVGYTLPNNIPDETRGTYLVPWKFDDHGMLRQRGRLLRRKSSSIVTESTENRNPSSGNLHSSSVINACRQYLYAGGFNFGPSRVIKDVPYDTMGLHNLFFGEELSMAVRLFTNGYDLYAPEETVCYHLWSRSHRPTNVLTGSATKTTKDEKLKERELRLREMSRAKVKKQLLGDRFMIGATYGLGRSRNAAAFAKHLGVNFNQQTFIREGWDCGELNSDDFAGNDNGNQSLFPADSVEAKVASLDSNAQSLITMFLRGMQK